MKKIKVKDGRAVELAKKRAEKLSAEMRKKIAQDAINARWSKYEEIESK